MFCIASLISFCTRIYYYNRLYGYLGVKMLTKITQNYKIYWFLAYLEFIPIGVSLRPAALRVALISTMKKLTICEEITICTCLIFTFQNIFAKYSNSRTLSTKVSSYCLEKVCNYYVLRKYKLWISCWVIYFVFKFLMEDRQLNK